VTHFSSVVLQISARYQPRTNDGQQWAKDYHTRLYNLTDDAVRGELHVLLQ
jgi:hypothetical protein